jgi:hypothetical protein
MNARAFIRGYMSKVAAAGFSTLPEAVSAQQSAGGGDPKSSSEMTIDKPKGKIKAKGNAADTLANNPNTVDAVSADIPPPPPKEPKAQDPNAPQDPNAQQDPNAPPGEPVLGDVPQDMAPPPPQLPEGVV